MGLPAETIEIRDKLVLINGKELPERRVLVKGNFDVEELEELSAEGAGPYSVYYAFQREAFSRIGPEMTFGVTGPFQIPESEYFVMSDNRDNCLDSRYYGAVPRDLIWGKPTRIYLSVQKDQHVRWDRINKIVR